MNKSNLKQVVLYVVAAIFIISIPLYMILTNAFVLEDGVEFLFKVEAFDPYDMFRGNYLDINFKEDTVEGEFEDYPVDDNSQVYVLIEKDKDGFAYFSDISITKPKDTKMYYKTNVRYNENLKSAIVETPTRYYINEDKALDAEKIYRENLDNTYVKVRVKEGQMVIVGVYINDKLIDSLVE